LKINQRNAKEGQKKRNKMSMRAASHNGRPVGMEVDRTLTLKQKLFCEEYLTNGRMARQAAIKAGFAESSAATRATNMLDLAHVRNYLKYRMEKQSKEIESTFDWKLKKLTNVTNKFIPDDIEHIGKGVAYGLSAITEMNKMEGHYAAEKHVNIDLHADLDLKKIEETARQAQLKYKRDY
jgi:phage terminase small subunit